MDASTTMRRERVDIVTTLVVAAVIAAIVVAATVTRWLETFGAGGATVGVPFNGVPAEISPREGLPSALVRVTAGDVTTSDAPAYAAVCLGASTIAGCLVWLAVIALFSTLALRFLRGRFFDMVGPRLLDVAAWTMLGGTLGIYLLDSFAIRGVLESVGLAEYAPSSWALSRSFFAVWIASIVLGLIAVAFRRGIRLQRETEGLV